VGAAATTTAVLIVLGALVRTNVPIFAAVFSLVPKSSAWTLQKLLVEEK